MTIVKNKDKLSFDFLNWANKNRYLLLICEEIKVNGGSNILEIELSLTTYSGKNYIYNK